MIVETLKKNHIFSSIKENDLMKIAPFFVKINFKKNEYIFTEGDPSDWFYIVGEGRVKIVKHSVMGKDIIFEIISSGDIFGNVAVYDDRRYPASAQAMKDTSVIKINRQDMVKVMEIYPILKLKIVKYLSDSLVNAYEMFKNIATERVDKRIASILLKLSEMQKKEALGYVRIGFTLTRREIADMVGTTTETSIRTLSKFQKNGMVKSSKGNVLVKKDALRNYLEYY